MLDVDKKWTIVGGPTSDGSTHIFPFPFFHFRLGHSSKFDFPDNPSAGHGRRESSKGGGFASVHTGISSQIGTKLRDWAVWQARAGCYSMAALSSNDSKTLYRTSKVSKCQTLRQCQLRLSSLVFRPWSENLSLFFHLTVREFA